MNKCEHCDKELDRKIFCNNSHRAMYYRKSKEKFIVNPSPEMSSKPAIRKVTKKDIEEELERKHPGACKHGSAIGLCKKGC